MKQGRCTASLTPSLIVTYCEKELWQELAEIALATDGQDHDRLPGVLDAAALQRVMKNAADLLEELGQAGLGIEDTSWFR